MAYQEPVFFDNPFSFSISTKDAVHVFRELGFEIVDMREEKGKSLLELAGTVSLGGNAVEDERKTILSLTQM